MEGPLVSVIVGVYNKERFVGECLRSVLAQTYQNWELIVVDDASTDGSLAEVECAVGGDPRVRILRRETNSGHPGVARNEGIRAARGKYVAFLDADDLWKREKLAVQTAYMEAHPEYSFTHTKCEVIDDMGDFLTLRHGGIYPPNGDCLKALLTHCFVCTSSVMVIMALLEETGGFSEELCFRSGQDYEFFVRCAKRHAFGMPNPVLVQYRRFSGTVSRNSENWRSMPSDFIRHKIFLHRPSLWRGRVHRRDVRNMALHSADENAYAARSQGHWGHAAWFAWQLICLSPWKREGWKHLMASIARRK
ncbi:MAG: glycosyltransferase family 2 protein [Kiritimatiellae bacterium]|nr:glycosyltransferase family 2 protein [Kiritimatiellia bacterium]